MQVIQNTKALKRALKSYKAQNKTIGFVPTMGYLHQGHLSLVGQAKNENDVVVVSIFVNPLQFGPKEDLKKYPRDLKKDQALLKNSKVDFLFVPNEQSFYPADFQTTVKVEKLSQPLCGKTRPIHFGGVATVVIKLLNIVMPNILYLGQKDYQQFKVVEKLVEDLSFPTTVRMAPTVRQEDGLAMSSRNVYLSAGERQQAPKLYRALLEVEKSIQKGALNPKLLQQKLERQLKSIPGLRLDYAQIVDAQTLQTVVNLTKHQRLLVACAVYFGKTRLIDNILLKV